MEIKVVEFHWDYFPTTITQATEITQKEYL